MQVFKKEKYINRYMIKWQTIRCQDEARTYSLTYEVCSKGKEGRTFYLFINIAFVPFKVHLMKFEKSFFFSVFCSF